MTDRPILFSGPMVRAILDGRKTQTRRVVTLTDGWEFESPPVLGRITSLHPKKGRFGAFILKNAREELQLVDLIPFPYGQPGDRLWVRETFAIEHQIESDQPPPHNDGRPIKLGEAFGGTEWRQCHYRATDPAPDLMYEDHPRDEPHCRWTPSIHMPRWASRITLEITGVRVERLLEISEADAQAEGIDLGGFRSGFDGIAGREHTIEFRTLWESINGAGSWDANPWVWVIEFRRV